MSVPREFPEAVELRMEGGVALVFGFRRPGDGGMARNLSVPGVIESSDIARYFDDSANPNWTIAPLDTEARGTLAREVPGLSGVAPTTHGVGTIWISGGHQCAFVDVFLSVADILPSGLSTFEDWLRIVRAAKDDLNTEVLLRLNFAADPLQPSDIDALKNGKRLATIDVEMRVRPRLVQWARDD